MLYISSISRTNPTIGLDEAKLGNGFHVSKDKTAPLVMLETNHSNSFNLLTVRLIAVFIQKDQKYGKIRN